MTCHCRHCGNHDDPNTFIVLRFTLSNWPQALLHSVTIIWFSLLLKASPALVHVGLLIGLVPVLASWYLRRTCSRCGQEIPPSSSSLPTVPDV